MSTANTTYIVAATEDNAFKCWVRLIEVELKCFRNIYAEFFIAWEGGLHLSVLSVIQQYENHSAAQPTALDKSLELGYTCMI